jgi:hypothetical protein
VSDLDISDLVMLLRDRMRAFLSAALPVAPILSLGSIVVSVIS